MTPPRDGWSAALSRAARRWAAQTRQTLVSLTPGGHVRATEVRAEIWRLGTRHLGWPLEGALAELKIPGLPAGRARLLRACVLKMRSDQTDTCG